MALSEFLWSFMEWLQRMEYIWIGERGYHYTRNFDSSEHLKDFFFLNESFKLELSRNGQQVDYKLFKRDKA